MELIKVDKKELDEYVLNSNKPHYLQTSAWGEVNKERGLIPHFLLLKDNDKTIGSAMLVEKKILNYSTFYCPRGFICDYNKKEDLINMISHLKKYVIKHNGLYIKIDPDIIIRKLDSEGNTKEEYKDELELIDTLKELGGKHRGFTTKFSESSMPRFTFRVDVTKDNLIETFHQTTRNLLKRNNPYGLKIEIGNDDNFDKFYKIMKDTAIRKQMYVEDEKFFSSFYYTLKKYCMSDLYLVSVNIEKLKEKYTSLIRTAQLELEEIKDSNKKGKINDLNDRLTKYNKELNEINKINKEELVLSSMITAKYKDMVWTIHGANANELPFLNANYEMYWQIIQDAKNQGYKYVDFYGTEGKIDKSSSAYGIYNFKVRFGGDFDEFIGEFDFITKPLANSIITTLLKIRRKIKYNLQKNS